MLDEAPREEQQLMLTQSPARFFWAKPGFKVELAGKLGDLPSRSDSVK